MKKWLLVGVGVVILWWILTPDQVELGAGVFAPDAPQQRMIDNPKSFNYKDYRITPLADFSLKAKVILREDYSLGRESELSPTDLVLGWDKMSDEAVLKHIEFRQSSRWYYYRFQSAPITQTEMAVNSANMHMIPAEDWIENDLDAVVAGQVIEIQGKLVEVKAQDGWHWKSSLRRDDTGGGACELVFVESIKIVQE